MKMKTVRTTSKTPIGYYERICTRGEVARGIGSAELVRWARWFFKEDPSMLFVEDFMNWQESPLTLPFSVALSRLVVIPSTTLALAVLIKEFTAAFWFEGEVTNINDIPFVKMPGEFKVIDFYGLDFEEFEMNVLELEKRQIVKLERDVKGITYFSIQVRFISQQLKSCYEEAGIKFVDRPI